MNLSGRLALTTLGDLLGTLHRSRTRGTLELIEDRGPHVGRTHRLHIDEGRVRFIESALGAERLGELLLGRRLITRAMHFDLLATLDEDSNASIGKRIIERHWVTPAALGAVAHEQAHLRLAALYQLRDARVAFRIARPTGGRFVCNIPLTAEEFLYGRPRARDNQDFAATDRPPATRVENPPTAIDSRRRRALLLLGLSPHASTGDVKQAFRRIAARLHPDRHLVGPEHHRELARQRFAQMTEAYHLLTG